MIDFLQLENKLKNNEISNCYIFCGSDEKSIKNSIKTILDKTVNKDFLDLNYAQLDGLTVDINGIINACETLPFMCEKKVVTVYRANFLRDKCDKAMEKVHKDIAQYLKNLPEECILIMYYIFENDREKESYKLKKLDKLATVVKFSKLKGAMLQKKIKAIFDKKDKKIDKTELALFCSCVENNMDIIENEVEKLCCYTYGREITSRDITEIISAKNDNDIFNLVDYLSQRKPQKALDILNELIFKGESITTILRMIERQFKILFDIKLGVEGGSTKEILARELKLHPFICEKMMIQSKKFTLQQIQKSIELSLETEKILKSSSVNSKTEMELLIINTARA
ncbi:DNA polymerase III subunit delta [Clostridium ganghwense]|uniref:DNA polymerase III subunit delta n=1 Tax=Clostridium ganghwense TaxID=312089 RepID=A0ABT4CRZ1_9CLOT|nr:DNA polymerase III subunit delta [Clostridium ganghwense]MCY6371837.1 DNA polymerase III subunit delta [Clostridium ganghwense]